MIYFFDNELNMVKVATSKNVISAVHEHELNGLILGTVEADLRYTEAFINDVDYFGYYYKDNYYLHKIKRVEHEHENELVRITGRHIFFEDMLYGDYIRDVRPVNRDALYILNQTISANTRWQTVMTDTSKLHSETYYWVPPMEVLNDLTENVGIEYEPKILFDGQNINGFQLHVANRIGEDTPIRVPFGSRVINLKHEVDYSEIVTALYGHGKGEEVGDGYGRRINFRDIVFRRNGVVSSPGQLYMENPNVTAQYGKDDGSPRFGRVVFEDIESTSELAIATYEAYMEQSRPKMLFEASVVDLGDVGMGDGVLIIRREHNVYFNARIHKLSVDLLYPEDAQVELGDYKHFKESKVARKSREKNNRVQGQLSDRITRLKLEANERFDNEVAQWKGDFEQALIDAHAQIEADRENMTNLIEDTRTEWTTVFDASVAEAHRLREENYAAMSDYVDTTVDTTRTAIEKEITDSIEEAERIAKLEYEAIRGTITSTIGTTRTAIEKEITESIEEAERKAQTEHEEIERRVTDTVDTTREELESSIDTSIESAKQYAEQQATAKANTVKEALEDVTNGHQDMLEGLQDNVMNIDDFLGDKTVGLNELLYNERILFEERINSINTWHYNLLRETQSLDDEFWEAVTGVIETDSNGDSYYRSNVSNVTNRSLYSKEEILFEAGETYTLSFQVQTYGHRSMDYVWIMGTDSTIYDGNYALHSRSDEQTADNIYWSGQYRTYYFTFKMPFDVYGRIRIGGDYLNNDLGAREYRIKKPYLTKSDNKQWLHNPEDSLQNLEEVTRRVTLLEDGREEFITKNQYDFETDEIEGSIKNIIETVDESTLIMQNHENWILTNGASIERTVDGFESKAWLSDIHNPNIIPYSAVHLPEHYKHWTGSNTTIIGTSYQDWLRVRTSNNVTTLSIISSPFAVVSGQQYTVTWYAWFDVSAADLSREFDYSFIQYTANSNVRVNPTRTFSGTIASWNIYKYKATFTTQYTDENATFRFGTTVPATRAVDVSFRFNRPKLEVGDRDTPYHNAFSNITQRADNIMLAVQGIGEKGFLNQSDITVRPDYVDIGSQRLDGSNIGSFLRVSPTGIDMVAEAMRLSGDLYVDGDITSLAVNAARGDIAYLKTNILTADSINATHIESDSIGASQIKADSVLINKLFANSFAAGHISTTALEAVEGEFASLFTAQLSATTITAEHIGSKSITVDEIVIDDALVETIVARSVFAEDITSKIGNFIDLNVGTIRSSILTANTIETSMLKASVVTSEKIKVDDVLVNRIIAQSVYANDVTSKVGDFIDLNAGNIVTAGLSANVIESDHIQVGTALIDKFFATSARIDELITKSHFVDEMHALTLNVVELNASEIRARLLTANTIEAEWLKGGTALIDRLFATTAMFERMMAKNAFVTTLSTVTLDLHELTIWRPDGVAMIQNGLARYGTPVPIVRYLDDAIETDDKTYWTNLRTPQTVGIAYGEHAGRWYNLSVGMGLRWDSDYATQYCKVRIEPADAFTASVANATEVEVTARRNEGLQWQSINVPLLRPTYRALTFYIQIYRRGENVYAPVEMRYGRSWVSDDSWSS